MGDAVERIENQALNELLGQRLPVLDDGFVRVIDYMGGDEAIVQAARVSYGAGTKQYHEDRGLIRYLLRNRHTTPLEMCELKLHVRVPMDCWRQWIRHRTANVNEYSTRYSVAIDAAQRTPRDAWRSQARTNRQGSGEFLDNEVGARLTAGESKLLTDVRAVYDERIQAGVAREQARKDLSLSTYTEAYWKTDLHNLLHFLALRMDSHAQHEIREYATVIGEQIVRRWCPIAWEAFEDYRLSGAEFSRQELAILAGLLESPAAGIQAAAKVGFLTADGAPAAKSRELDEFTAKLARLNVTPPWAAKP